MAEEQAYSNYKIVQGPDGMAALDMGGEVVTTERLTTLLVTDLLASVHAYCEERIDNAVVAVPGTCRPYDLSQCP